MNIFFYLLDILWINILAIDISINHKQSLEKKNYVHFILQKKFYTFIKMNYTLCVIFES